MILLMDGDMIIFRAAISSCEATLWDDNVYTESINLDLAIYKVDIEIKEIKRRTQADKVVIAFSSSENFRKKIDPNYKHNRKLLKKPCGYKLLKEHVETNYEVYEISGLEGDDVLGILATAKNGNIKGERAIWSYDKDFKTIPCTFYKQAMTGKMLRINIDKKNADYNFLLQTLTGDSTDGYVGCRGVGEVKGKTILPSIKDFTLESGWKAVVEAFEKGGETEKDALKMARLARILRKSDYDFKNKEVKLWNP